MRFTFLILLLWTQSGVAGSSAMSVNDAHHLLNRTGFGASPYELQQFVSMSRSAAIDRIISDLYNSPQQPYPDWTNQPAPHHFARNELTQVERREFNEARESEIRNLREWWVREMIETTSPQTERLVLFWHNHFATGYSGINDQAISIARQHMTIRQHAAGNFRDFLKAIIRDPAMLNYLDNDNSRKAAPNENLARELLELFTLGEGNYQESDIKNIARALTGYGINRIANLRFEFRSAQHDNSKKTVFGKEGTFDGEDVIDLILEQPEAARFIAEKFWHFLVSHDAPANDELDHLASQFRDADYDIKVLYQSILNSDQFWAQRNRAGLIRSPIALTIGTIRSTGIVPDNWQTIPSQLSQLGQQLFDPPNVAGWPGGKAWITPSRLLNRLEWLKRFSQTCKNCDTMAMANTMQPTNDMVISSSMMAEASNEMYSDKLLLHMASEEFDEPVSYRLTVSADDTILWSSGALRLEGGHDTKRFGRARGPSELPWRDVHFSLPEHAHSFDAIELEFLNDKTAPGMDRNLFIKYASFQERRYNAEDGKQINQCPRRKRAKGGVMLCNGKLILSNTVTETDNSTTANGDLMATGIYPKSVQPPDSGRSRVAISYSMTDVKLYERAWHTLTVNYINRDQGKRYQLLMNENECWPECFNVWPDCENKTSAVKRWVIDVDDDYKSQCAYEQLHPTEQALVDTLIHQANEIHKLASSSRKLRGTRFNTNFQAWTPYMEELTRTASPPQINAPTIKVVSTKAVSSGMTGSARGTMPLPTGRDSQQYRDDLLNFTNSGGLSGMARLLLPGITDEQPTLSATLTNLSYQLH